VEDRTSARMGGADAGGGVMSSYDIVSNHRKADDLSIADIRETLVCGPCADVVGPAKHRHVGDFVMVQTGTCAVHTRPSEPIWPWKDYNRFVELCRCCGTVALYSGSRWAVWFCPTCKEQVLLLNRRLGRYAIPIGRHSVHAGRFLSAKDIESAVAVHVFVESMNANFGAMELLRRWAKHVIRQNLRAIGEDDDAAIPITSYCRAAQKNVDPLDRFREMCAWLSRESLVSQSEEDHS
jgi:hypothetical protein